MAIYQFAYKSTDVEGVAYVNTWHFVTQPPELGSEPAASDVIATIDTAYRSLYKNCLYNGITVNTAELGELLPPASLDVPRGAVINVGQNGTLTGGDGKMPPALDLIIAKKTGVPRRWARGYVAIPSPRSSGNLSGSAQWTGNFLTACQALAAIFDDDYEIGTVSVTSVIPVVYSRVQHAKGASQPWAQIQAGTVRLKPSWRRSRMTSP